MKKYVENENSNLKLFVKLSLLMKMQLAAISLNLALWGSFSHKHGKFQTEILGKTAPATGFQRFKGMADEWTSKQSHQRHKNYIE